MKCLYYPAPTLESARRIFDDLQSVGLEDRLLHVISEDTAGLRHQHIPSGNYLETLDLIRHGLIGTVIGFLLGLIGIGLLMLFEPFGAHAPRVVFLATLMSATLFGAWEGGLAGIASENSKLAGFHDDLVAGCYLILIYAPAKLESVVRKMMLLRHPEVRLAAIDRHFINPFSAVRPAPRRKD